MHGFYSWNPPPRWLNPDLPTEPVLLKEPIRPTPASVKLSVLLEELRDTDDMKRFERRENHYYKDMAIYGKETDALPRMMNTVFGSLTSMNLEYAKGLETPYQQIKALKTRLAPSDRAIEQEVVKKYQLLKKTPKSKAVIHVLKFVC